MRRAAGRVGLGVFWLGGLYMTWTVVNTTYHWHLGSDAHAYWRTGHPVGSMYGALGYSDRYLYSPAFAQAIAPISHLPWPVFLSIWMTAEILAFIWLLRPLGWHWTIPLVFWLAPEWGLGNIMGFVAVAVVVGMTRPWAWALILLTKPPLGVGVLWFAARREWRHCALAVGTTAAVAALSFAWHPQLWLDWAHFLMKMSHGKHTGMIGGQGVRAVLAAGLTIFAARTNRPWLVPVALLVATPVFSGTPSCTVLAALPRLYKRRSGPGAAPNCQDEPSTAVSTYEH